ncbi:MAG TPA: quaternary ammonium compound efflux SMR transporter SugE [Gammaproteobacteria bacterium]|nr:quaternary ammonium compound efflux SMR transporter SugE [Gammaproteobacteria bacterium]
MAWWILIVAGLLEVAWAVGLKLSDGLTRPIPAALTAVAVVASMGLLALSLRSLPLGTAYAVWTGIGAVGSVILGILLFGESAAPGRLICIGLIVAGIVGLRLTSPGSGGP